MSEKEKQIAKETEDIIAQGFYLYNETKVQLTRQNLYKEVVILDENHLAYLNANQKEVTAGKIQGVCLIKVVNMDAFDALRTEHLDNALVLNFADPYTPGGNFLSGICGQEQSLCRNSTLFQALKNPEAEIIYEKYKLNKAENYDGMIVAPFVDIIRDGTGKLLKHPVHCAVISLAAVNLQENNPKADDLRKIMLRKIRGICLTAVNLGYRELVLGAWGCGAFRQQAADVAEYFHEVLCKEGFDKYFRSIIFAVKDNSPKKDIYQNFAQILARKKMLSLMECLLSSTHLDYFRRYRKRLDEIQNFELGHGKDHPLRVLMLTTFIADKLELSAEALETLYKAVCFHDAGRVNGLMDPKHGALGARWYHEHYGEDKEVEFLIKFHSLDDDIAARNLKEMDFTNKEELWLLYQILKDADALDRVRFKYYGNEALNEEFLRLDCSKELVAVAYKLLESDLEV